MKDAEREVLQRAFDDLSHVEQRRLIKRASKEKKRREREANAGKAAYRIPRNQRRAGRSSRTVDTPVEDYALELLGAELADQNLFDETEDGERGTVVTTYSGWADVLVGNDVVLCHVTGKLARTQKTSLAVGDEVVVVRADDELWAIRSVLPRRTRLSRPDPHNAGLERVIVANVDVVGITVSVVAPELHPRVIDRMWLAIERGGATPLVVVNKTDLLDDELWEYTREDLAPYVEAGLQIVYVSADSGDGIEELREAIRGKMSSFVGHSGVGKSSLLNRLLPDAEAITGEVREADGRGRHTTTSSTLYRLPGNTRVVDTPGIRSFGLWKLELEEIREFFSEFEEHQQYCRFANCTHTHEPECGVIAAVEEGEIPIFRYETYVRLMTEEDEP